MSPEIHPRRFAALPEIDGEPSRLIFWRKAFVEHIDHVFGMAESSNSFQHFRGLRSWIPEVVLHQVVPLLLFIDHRTLSTTAW